METTAAPCARRNRVSRAEAKVSRGGKEEKRIGMKVVVVAGVVAVNGRLILAVKVGRCDEQRGRAAAVRQGKQKKGRVAGEGQRGKRKRGVSD